MMKRLLAMGMVCMLSVSMLLGGCSSGGKEGDGDGKKGDSGGDTAKSSYTLPIVKDKITLKVLAFTNYCENIDTNEFTKFMEEKTNIHIDWDLANSAAGEITQKAVMGMASGNMHDIFLGGIDATSVAKFGSEGVLIPLNSYIDKSVNFKKVLNNSKNNLRQMLTCPDGNIYTFPHYNEDAVDVPYRQNAQMAFINKKWLDKLGLKVPETTEEFYNVLKAFKERDPNGNGRQDELPILSARYGGTWNGSPDGFLLSAFVTSFSTTDLKMLINDGKVVAPYATPEWKEGLRYLNRLYKEGLLNNDAYGNIRGTDFPKYFKDAPATVGVIFNGILPNLQEINTMPIEDVKNSGKVVTEYVPLPPLKGPNGVRSTPILPGYSSLTKAAISSGCKYPEAAFKWMDYLTSEEVYMKAAVGMEGRDWEKAAPGDVDINGQPATYRLLVNYPDPAKQNVTWNYNYPACVAGFNIRAAYDNSKFNANKFYLDGAKQYKPYEKPILPNLLLTSVENDMNSEYDKNIRTYIRDTAVPDFITGKKNIDAEWDAYLTELNKRGLKQYEDFFQKAYDRQYGKK